jgi:hypothetical protein
MADIIVLGQTLMLIGSKDPQRAEDLFLSANGEVKEHNEIRYIIIKDKPESNETESGN